MTDTEEEKVTATGLRKRLSGSITNRSEFSWLTPIVTQTLDNFVREALKESPPDPEAFIPNLVSDHLSEITKLLDICVQKREKIFLIESDALIKGQEFLAAEKLEEGDKALLAISVRSLRVTSGEAGDDTKDVEFARARSELLKSQRLARLAMHNVPGSSLNYGERVSHERNIYALNILTILERMHALKRSQMGHYMGDLPVSAEWDGDLDSLVYMVRNLLHILERTNPFERTEEFLLPILALGDIPLMPEFQEGKLPEQIQPYIELDFQITPEDLRNANKLIHHFDPDRCRLAGFAITAPFFSIDNLAQTPDENWKHHAHVESARAFLARQSFACDVLPPPQIIPGGEVRWMPRACALAPLSLLGSARQAPEFVPELSGLNPFGIWKLRISTASRSGVGNLWSALFSSYAGNHVKCLHLSLAVRFSPASTEAGGYYY